MQEYFGRYLSEVQVTHWFYKIFFHTIHTHSIQIITHLTLPINVYILKL